MSDTKHVRLDCDGAVATITLCRPPVNVLNIEMMEQLGGVLETALGREGTGVVLLQAEGKAFCAGVDIADHTADKVGAMIHAFGGIFKRLLSTDIPVVASVGGAALGGGMELVTCCDIVLASERAKFGQPEVQLAVFPPVAAAVLPHVLGLPAAMDLILSGRTILADEARNLGLVAQVFATDAFESSVAAYVRNLAGLSRPVLRMAKRTASRELRDVLMGRIAEADRVYLDEMMKLRDPHEGLAAFVEKRKPEWQHA